MDGEQGVGGGAKCRERGSGQGGEKRGLGTRVQIDHMRDRGGGCRQGNVERTGFAVGRQGQEAVARDGEGFYEVTIMEIEGGSEGGVDRKINLAGVTGREPDALEFAVLEANEECAVGTAVLGARKTGDVIPRRISARVELVGCLEYDTGHGAAGAHVNRRIKGLFN